MRIGNVDVTLSIKDMDIASVWRQWGEGGVRGWRVVTRRDETSRVETSGHGGLAGRHKTWANQVDKLYLEEANLIAFVHEQTEMKAKSETTPPSCRCRNLAIWR
ncbi:unnamed protein product [Protopolystoma xenopodis]|uniref:Uncharacterized protein n=1 Tax=Protopolystoma xenopodis TaxID=117903 RepID=A0A3S5FDC7_9PLAT|nr:unnamed protein product [Protopolystoma xenopodis]